MNPRTKEQLDAMSPEKRAIAEAMMAKHRTPEARDRQTKALEALEREVEETGGITTADGVPHKVKPHRDPELAEVGAALKARREEAGLSLDDVAREAGIERSALAKLERGANANPTLRTLRKVANAIGGRIRIEVGPAEGGG